MKVKQLIAGIMIGITLSTPLTTEGKSLLAHCKEVRKQERLVKIFDGTDLNKDKIWNTLDNKGDLVIEIDYGVVRNNKGDGRILNTTSKRNNYISYRRVRGARKGDIIMSVFVYSPDRKSWDDIEMRYDWILDNRKGK